MANELDKTIEELEAEVLDELEEANGADAPKKSAGKADSMDKVKGEVQDTGNPVVSPDQKDSPAKKVAAKAKEVSSDAQQKGEGKPDKMPAKKDAGQNKSLAAGHVPDGEESLAEMEDDDKKETYGNMTKAEMQDTMLKAMKSMKKGEMENMYASYMKNSYEEKKETPEEKEKAEAVEKRVKEIDVKEHVDALMNGEGDLSEEFKRKAATVFEAAVKSKVRDEVSRIEDDYRNELDENINANKDELTEKLTHILTTFVKNGLKKTNWQLNVD